MHFLSDELLLPVSGQQMGFVGAQGVGPNVGLHIRQEEFPMLPPDLFSKAHGSMFSNGALAAGPCARQSAGSKDVLWAGEGLGGQQGLDTAGTGSQWAEAGLVGLCASAAASEQAGKGVAGPALAASSQRARRGLEVGQQGLGLAAADPLWAEEGLMTHLLPLKQVCAGFFPLAVIHTVMRMRVAVCFPTS